MNDPNSPELHVTRRTASAALAALLSSCASRPSGEAARKLHATHIAFPGPSYKPELVVNISAGSVVASAATLRETTTTLNQRLPGWYDVVVPGFTEAFTMELARDRVEVEPLAWGTPDIPSVRCFLTAGFVYKTYLSSAHAPFVEVVLEFGAPGGRILYHKLYVATDRPFNMFMASIPAQTPFLLNDLSSLKANPKPALDALRSLSAQLGERFGGEVLERVSGAAASRGRGA